ncbi:hypothetical protein TNCV_4042271 [Trichonephila clavipes]|nr:hypothetical protein TNCV_4042271 [Trichonephila clavipes]
MTKEDYSIWVNILLVVDSASLDKGIGGRGSDTVAAAEELEGKRCAWVEDDMGITGVDIDIFGFGIDERVWWPFRDLCKIRFKVLRDRYRKEKARVLPSGSEAKARKMWPFSEMLSFLDPYMQKGSTWSNITDTTSLPIIVPLVEERIVFEEEAGIIHEAGIVHEAGTVQEA